jgi:hypothetical protein
MRFKSADNVFGVSEYFDINWIDNSKIMFPPKTDWDYSRELKIEDIDVWEILYESTDISVFAAWSPYAEFYLIRPGYALYNCGMVEEVYYGVGAQSKLIERMKELNIPYSLQTAWVDPEDMWLYQKPEKSSSIIIL